MPSPPIEEENDEKKHQIPFLLRRGKWGKKSIIYFKDKMSNVEKFVVWE
jgi:hypothetical protein